tara:strand:+ start:140 stop:706 length:567 start_codon:yes stop_codon:yes gene_type:complete
MNHLYGDGNKISFENYKEILNKETSVYNLNELLLDLTNHIFDSDSKIIQSWKTINKMSLQNFEDSKKWINQEIKTVKILEENVLDYKNLYKEYLFKINELLSKHPELKKSEEEKLEEETNNEVLKKLENEQNRIKKISKQKSLKKKEKNERILKIILQVITIFICLLIIFLINSRFNIVNGMIKFRKK